MPIKLKRGNGGMSGQGWGEERVGGAKEPPGQAVLPLPGAYMPSCAPCTVPFPAATPHQTAWHHQSQPGPLARVCFQWQPSNLGWLGVSRAPAEPGGSDPTPLLPTTALTQVTLGHKFLLNLHLLPSCPCLSHCFMQIIVLNFIIALS